MKMLYDNTFNKLQCNVSETLNESTGKSEKIYKIKGVFSSIGVRNRNGRLYPRHIWLNEVQKYNENVLSTPSSKYRVMRLEHPDYAEPDIYDKPIAVMEKLYIEGDLVMGEALILDNEYGRTLKALLEAGITEIGVSSRGVGEVGTDGTVNEFSLITYDVVNKRSDLGITEGKSFNESLITEGDDSKNKDYNIDPETKEVVEVEVCDSNKCILSTHEDIDNAILLKFNELLASIPSSDDKDNSDKNINDEDIDNVIDQLQESKRKIRRV